VSLAHDLKPHRQAALVNPQGMEIAGNPSTENAYVR
jgi:hypothetical protein